MKLSTELVPEPSQNQFLLAALPKNKILINKIKEVTPSIPIVSEETSDNKSISL